ncbi:hypothetical protein TRP66_07680 [Pseudomonas sp. JDS28PS106]|uniref:hypothetical protein n=1 Tax=Pseudomonas sp. JDS28PS106 TaxID=2497235 RepID=UPI002FCEF682
MTEQDIYQKIGQLLYEAGPSSAKKIITRARLFAEDDGGSYEFDYLNDQGKVEWFQPDGKAVRNLTMLLVDLRKLYVSNGLCENGKAWSACEITLNLEPVRISIDYIYT